MCVYMQARDEDVEEVVVEGFNADQTAPLLQTIDNTSHSRKPIKKLVHVLHSILAFKAHNVRLIIIFYSNANKFICY